MRIPQVAYEAAWKRYQKTGERSSDLETVIAKDPQWAYWYAVDVINNNRFPLKRIRWPEGESAIATDPEYAYGYADYVIDGGWPEGEPAISTHPQWAYWYAVGVIKKRWLDIGKPEAESTISKDPEWWREYKKNFKIK